ncbi:fungal specific transcription factor domain-containing protein [Aspergillus stella-maris]|uniref:fungal specific transcription factor domain-containing protein n=1 Tax=Aspergillus stella-maris TaxID=1810926 RepID=UPI003CCDB894
MSLMFMTDDEAKKAGLPEASTSDLVRNWYDTAYFFLNEADFLRNYNLKTVQAIAILLGLGKSVGDFDSQPLLQSTGIRIGQIIGMNREPPLVSESRIVQEISRRTWWTLVICEWLSVPPRPPCIQEADFEVNLPLDLSDAELSTPDIAGIELQSRPRPVQYHLAMIAIAKAVYRFQYRLARLDGKGTRALENIVLTADEDLATIILDLPSHLAEAPAPIDHIHDDRAMLKDNECPPWVSLQWRSLTLTLLTYRMRVNRVLQHRWRRYQSPEDDTLLARSKVICIESAITIITLVNQYKSALARHRPCTFYNRAMTFYVFSAAMTLALEAHELPEPESTEYLDNIKLCLSFLEFLRDHNALAGRAITVLTEFLDDSDS